MENTVRILRETRLDPRFPLSRRELAGLCALILDSLGLEGMPVTVKLVDDREIARLNHEFLGCEGPTNVLSFPAEEPDEEEFLSEEAGDADEADDMDGMDEADNEDGEPAGLGELALSVDALARETDLYGQPPVAHLARLLAHGFLHLAGYDHGEAMYDLTDAAVDRALLEYPETEER
ncbi:rRNA maturation RNase YbeY [Pseudodesulfovibrio sp.]|uniref:rRNA maturation RNase YbeY n=1 Tax=Pseudodesulfovibrio sp. TaxID=2035812 RepID=UPI00262298C3|nr:rRNA maturation RNase YbeY [Pseudodesulfovibrio sp.]MDD3311494.1 rRNA maturation RNase YbeY [Pseudodesulfovibrio sp.]